MLKSLPIILAGVALAVLSACSFVPAATSPAPSTPSGANPLSPTSLPTRAVPVTDIASPVLQQVTPSATIPSTSEGQAVAIVWERSGGIAGICQRLTIQLDGAYLLQDCRNESTVGQGRLPKGALEQLNTWLRQYTSFTWAFVPPANSADMFADHYTFNGRGSQSPSAQEQEMINGYLAELVRELAELRVTPPATSPGQAGIEGQVLIGPACPVVRADVPCPDTPYQATVSVLDPNHNPVTTFQSDAQGHFRVALAPGTYILQPESPGPLPHAPEQTVVVTNEGYTAVTIIYDSGIR